LIEQTGWDLTVNLDKEAPRGEFAVYLDDAVLFSRYEQGRLPVPEEIVQALRIRLFGESAESEAEHGTV
jgi:selT/selW/selH-like putative selenoprotein